MSKIKLPRVTDSAMAKSNRGPVRWQRRSDGQEYILLSLDQLKDLAINVDITRSGPFGREVNVEFD